MNRPLLALCGLSLAVAAVPAFAHHSGAMFERDKEVTLNGVIK